MENLDFNRSHGSCRVAAAWHPATDGKATDGNPWVAAMQWVGSWSEAVELVLVCGSGVGVGGAVLLGNVEL